MILFHTYKSDLYQVYLNRNYPLSVVIMLMMVVAAVVAREDIVDNKNSLTLYYQIQLEISKIRTNEEERIFNRS